MRLNPLPVGALFATIVTGFSQPQIITQPQNETNAVGTSATFMVLATNAAPLTYQWQKYLADWSDLIDHTNATLVLTNVQTADEADYRVAVSNVDGATNSDPAHLYVITPPRITKVTNYNASVSLGAPVKMQVWATGTAPLRYQWWHMGMALAGKTTGILDLTNVQTVDAGLYALVVSNWAGAVSTNLNLDVDPTFTQVTTGALVTDAKHWHGQAWGDYDNDGYLDLFITTVDRNFTPIYHNNHDGTFTRTNVPSLQGYTGIANWWYTWVDYDNDGQLDLFVADYSEYYGESAKNLLFHNNGDGTFTRVTTNAVGQEGAISIYGSWGDYDRDGDLDLVVANGMVAASPAKNWFYQNLGNGNFLKLTNIGPVVTEVGRFAMPVWVDVDNDGWPDLFVTAWGTNSLYHNTGAGSFTKVSGDPLVSEANYWTGPAWADYDNDGNLDVFIPSGGIPGYSGPVALYRNDGAGYFTKMTTNDVGPLVAELVNSDSCAWGDYDNDGWIDLFVPNGYDDGGIISPRQSLLYRNNGDGTFTKVTTGSPSGDWGTGLAANWVDIDNDGFLDLFVTPHPEADYFVNSLYRNNGNSSSWLCIKCEGTASTRWGTGAKVRVKATIRGREMSQLRLIDAGGSSWGGQSFVAHFGLGDATNVDLLRIEWTSGIVQELHNVPVKQYLTVTEPTKLRMERPGELQIQCWKGMAYAIQCSTNLLDWNVVATVTNLAGKVTWDDPNSPSASACFYSVVKQ